jgi:hypothetical protein
MSEQEWAKLLGSLVIGEAIALPITDEAEGQMRRIRLAPRLTPHVRHLAKYIDIPVPEGRAFVFWRDGAPAGPHVRTLRDFVTVVEQTAAPSLNGHLRRSDFSRWIADVFGDYPLAKTVRRLEDEYRAGNVAGVTTALSQAIRSRYEFLEPELAPIA